MKQDEKDIVAFIDEVIENDTSLSDYKKTWGGLSSFLTDYEHLKGLHHLTQKEIAARCGTTQSAISRLERMRGKPTYELLRRISEAAGGELFITPMSDFTITLPYDLQERAKCMAEKQDTSVAELMEKLVRDGIDNTEYRDECVGQSFKLVISHTDRINPVGQYSVGGSIVEGLSGPDTPAYSFKDVV